MDIAIDVETMKRGDDKISRPILDGTGRYFVLGCIYGINSKGGEVKKTFYEAKEMWGWIKDRAIKEERRGKKLRVWGHNIRYDFYNIVDIKDKGLNWFSENPFIVSYHEQRYKTFDTIKQMKNWLFYAKKNHIRFEIISQEEEDIRISYKRESIKFGDTMSLYRMSLKNMGDIIGMKKTEMPEEISGYITKAKLEEIAKYCMNDCKICLHGVKYMKNKLREDGLEIRNMCTINQIAIQYVIKKLQEVENRILVDNGEGYSKYTYKTKYPDIIHEAYRASLARVWNVGIFEGITDIDVNSLYPYALTQLDYLPDLSTEEYIKDPLKIYNINELFNEIGISRVMLINEKCDIGLIPIRAERNTYVPLKGKYIIGTYTNLELKEAMKSGYRVIKVDFSILYRKSKNSLREIYRTLYKKRMNAEDKFNDFFYKAIMNSSLGKFGQHKVGQEIFIDSIEKAEEYKKENTEIISGIERSRDVMYKRVIPQIRKSYYAPIIPTYVTAMARIIMYRHFKTVGKDNLLYSDTDSILMKGKDKLKEFRIGKGLGEFKIEKDSIDGSDLINKRSIIWGSKAKSIGNNIAVSGAFKSDLSIKQFEKGIVKSKKMLGIKNELKEEAGKFIVEEKDLTQQKENWLGQKETMDNIGIYIDKGIDHRGITPFLKDIERIDRGNTSTKK